MPLRGHPFKKYQLSIGSGGCIGNVSGDTTKGGDGGDTTFMGHIASGGKGGVGGRTNGLLIYPGTGGLGGPGGGNGGNGLGTSWGQVRPLPSANGNPGSDGTTKYFTGFNTESEI